MRDLSDELAASSLLAALKALLRERQIAYSDIAERMELSLPTVKRMLNKTSLPLDRLLALCRIAEIELSTLMARVEVEQPRHCFISEEQDRFFAERPEFLTYLILLVESGLGPSEIEQTRCISRRSGEAYLRKLEELGFLEREPGFRVRLKIEPPLGFGPGSEVLKRSQGRFVSSIVDKVVAGEADDGCFALIKPLYLDVAVYAEMLQKIAEVIDKYSYLSKQTRKRALEAQVWSVAVAAAPGSHWESGELRELY